MALDESCLEYFSPCLLEFGSEQVSFFLSLKKFQEQLQSAGSDVSAQLQQNFDAQVSALKAEHQVIIIFQPSSKRSNSFLWMFYWTSIVV